MALILKEVKDSHDPWNIRYEIVSNKCDGENVIRVISDSNGSTVYTPKLLADGERVSTWKPQVVYICDRLACVPCHKDCRHTSDITHAINFQQFDNTNKFFEKDENE